MKRCYFIVPIIKAEWAAWANGFCKYRLQTTNDTKQKKQKFNKKKLNNFVECDEERI